MLALRSTLVVDALDGAALRAATSSAADAVLIDLARASTHGQRDEARTLAVKHARAIAKTGRPVLARVSDARSGELAADIEAVTGAWLVGVVLAGAEAPQDVRDADVQVRMREMRRRLTPGQTALIPEVDSAEGILALSRMLVAVDRFGAVALSVDGLRADLRLPAAADGPGGAAGALVDHAMAQVALAADAARLLWLVHVAHHRPGVESIPTRAHAFGAAGVTVHNEGETRGMNSLFTPPESEVPIARSMLAEWERVRRRGGVLGVVAGEVPQSRDYDRLVDRRTVRRARTTVALADAIAAREAVE